jgi:hypothetical protein
MRVTTIITSLPPAIDGVGDYALHLARRLRQNFDIETDFIVGDPKWAGARQIEGFAIAQVSACSANALLSVLPSESATPVLLHYVGYGYAKRGCPIWLVDGLQRWQGANIERSLVTMFHEVYAYGRPPWTSSFWLSPLQRNLAARLAKLSDRTLTSRQGYAKLLYELSLGKQTQIPALPVFSTIGEPEQVLPLAQRKPRVVVFGSPSNRLRVYRESFAQLSQICQCLGIEEIWDVGPSVSLGLSSVNGVPIVELGQQSATEISNILLNSLAGFFDYHPDYLGKSTIFAAYCAHGLLPISPRYSTLPLDGLEGGKHYWMPDDPKPRHELQAIATNAHAWYQSHNLPIHAKTFASLLGNQK